MFDPRGDFWKIKINWSNKEWKNGNKKVDICRGGYQILCQRKRRSKIRRKPTFGLVNFCKTRLTDVEIWLYFGRHFQEDIMMFFFIFIYNIPSNIFQSNWILLIMKSCLILELVCELRHQVLAQKQRNRKIPICLDFQGGEGAINHAPDKKVFNYPYFRCDQIFL